MPLGPHNTQNFHLVLYATEMETITLLKRGLDQNSNIITAYTIFNCRHSYSYKTGQAIQGTITGDQMQSGDHCVWHIPTIELNRVGLQYMNVLDQIIDQNGFKWEVEAPGEIIRKLWFNHQCYSCVRLA